MRATEKEVNEYLKMIADRLETNLRIQRNSDNGRTIYYKVLQKQSNGGWREFPYSHSARTMKDTLLYLQGVWAGMHHPFTDRTQQDDYKLIELWSTLTDEEYSALANSNIQNEYYSAACMLDAVYMAREGKKLNKILAETYHNRKETEHDGLEWPPVNLPASLLAKWEQTKKLLGYDS